MVFDHISFASGRRIAFRLALIADAGKLFGLALVPSESITATACYEMEKQSAACTLSLTVRYRGQDYQYEYLLTEEKRLMLTEKMEIFFRQRIGTDLRAFSSQHTLEQVPPS
ncbi:MAG: hypothetical protein IJU20_04045 [Clostridia bacterium]|nr:hypothetical protein [Clostridia bacterium]